ncbi:MAG: tRNA glutamyl-Q(34) synthetase GluQRS [Pseudomonadota bacterium]
MSSPSDNSAIATIATGKPYIGRFAPSPTGPLHFGSLLAALVSYLDARHHGGQWLVRVEDIDPPREIKGASDQILRSLEAHGLHWDQDVRFQRHSDALHNAALEHLKNTGNTFHCRCARKTLIADGHSRRYPGICRLQGHTDGAVRVRVTDTPLTVTDRWQSPLHIRLDESPGDFIVKRRDALIAYQLAVVVDDADQAITHIVRGHDLYESTPRQMWLQHLLGLDTPQYAHFPVLVGADGHKLSKQTGAPALDDTQPENNLKQCFRWLELDDDAALPDGDVETQIDWAISRYRPDSMTGKTEIKLSTKN